MRQLRILDEYRSILCLVAIWLSGPAISSAQEIRFYGDILLSRGTANYVDQQGVQPLQAALVPFVTDDALRVANLEGAVGDPTECVAGHKPCFSIKEGALDLLSPFDVITLQNNHSLDVGEAGLKRTVRALRQRKITTLGGRGYSTLIDTEDGNIAIIAVTDVVNAQGDRRHLAAADGQEVFYEIARLKRQATFVVVYVHWGKELDPVPTKRMKELAHRYVQAGADLVVGSHPHVMGDVACVEGRPVVYSLGNFLFDQKYEATKRGAVLGCQIDAHDKLVCELAGYGVLLNSYLPQLQPGSYQTENAELAACRPTIEKSWTGKFTHDGRDKRLVLKRATGKGLSYLELHDAATGKREYKTPPMPILKLQPVDLTGDGILEILLVQKIYSSIDNEVAKRVYIYSLDGRFHALWRGSSLSRPLIDATFIANREPLLVALHSADSFLVRRKGDPERILMTYRWNGFGFTGVREVKGAPEADGVTYRNGTVRFVSQGRILDQLSESLLR